MGTRSRTTYELQDLLEKPSDICVLCRFTRAGVSARIDAIFYEQVTDRTVRAEIRDARGFCRRHSDMVSRHADALGTALIMQDVLINELRALEGGAYDLKGSSGPFSRLLDQRRPALARCPLCAAEDELDGAGVDALLEGLRDTALADTFRTSCGLCLPHLRLTRERARDEATWKIVLETERRNLQTLADTLGQLARKSDYRFTHEGVSPDEAASWRRALRITSGMGEGV